MRVVFLGLCVFLASALALCAGEESRYEDVLKQTLTTLDKVSTTLAAVRDRETANAARPELQKAATAWQTVQKTADSLPPPERGEKDRLAKTYKARLSDAVRKVHGEAMRLESIPGGQLALREIRVILARPEPK